MSGTLSVTRSAPPGDGHPDRRPAARRLGRVGPRIAPYVFISPFYVLYALFLIVPIGVSGLPVRRSST